MIAASVMCAGGRIGAHHSTVRTEQGYVELDGQRYTSKAVVYQLNGYSAHADKDSLIRFIKGMCKSLRKFA